MREELSDNISVVINCAGKFRLKKNDNSWYRNTLILNYFV